jgi:hypothetical protein
MSRAIRKAGWALAAACGISIVPIAIAQTPAHSHVDESGKTAAAPVDTAARRALEIKVELAWLEDTETFPCQIAALFRSGDIEVRGYVPSEAVRDKAVRIARDASSATIVDHIHVVPTVIQPSRALTKEALQPAIALCLRTNFSGQLAGLQVSCNDRGEVTVKGSIATRDEKLAISKRLQTIAGCTCVHNRLVVPGTHDEPALAVSAFPVAKTPSREQKQSESPQTAKTPERKIAPVPPPASVPAPQATVSVPPPPATVSAPPATASATPSSNAAARTPISFSPSQPPSNGPAPSPVPNQAAAPSAVRPQSVSPYPVVAPASSTPPTKASGTLLAPVDAPPAVPPMHVSLSAPLVEVPPLPAAAAAQLSYPVANQKDLSKQTAKAPPSTDAIAMASINIPATETIAKAPVHIPEPKLPVRGEAYETTGVVLITDDAPAAAAPSTPAPSKMAIAGVKSAIERSCGSRISSVEVKADAGNRLKIQFTAPSSSEADVYLGRIMGLPELAPYVRADLVDVKINLQR